jgi:SAM-dependent methyltransferase
MPASGDDLGVAYDAGLFGLMAERATAAAEAIVPLVLEHVQPGSVVDYGGGTGEWAAAFRRHGAGAVLVVDGPWVERERLAVGPGELVVHDVREPFAAGREFDLAVCLEVAGHVPPDREGVFADSLAALAPVLLFSAPVPHQPGVGGGALNNRWPAHWAGVFAERDMAWVDCLRLRVWDDPRVTWWYAQNIALVVREDRLAELPALAAARTAAPLALVHPGMLRHVADRPAPGPRALARALAGALVSRARRGRRR